MRSYFLNLQAFVFLYYSSSLFSTSNYPCYLLALKYAFFTALYLSFLTKVLFHNSKKKNKKTIRKLRKKIIQILPNYKK